MKKPRKKRLICAAAFVLIIIIYIAGNAVSVISFSKKSENISCDAAIVPGAAVGYEGVSEVYKQRLNHAIELYNSNQIKYIIVTGGVGEGNMYSDAYIAGMYLRSQGIPDSAILLEEKSTVTQENMKYSKEIMDENGLDSALIVSDPLHMKRSMLMAKDEGINAHTSPTESSAYKTFRTKAPFALREIFLYIGYKWYRAFN